MKQTIERRILNALRLQAFRDFYEGIFDDFLCGGDGSPTDEEILQEIKKIFKL